MARTQSAAFYTNCRKYCVCTTVQYRWGKAGNILLLDRTDMLRGLIPGINFCKHDFDEKDLTWDCSVLVAAGNDDIKAAPLRSAPHRRWLLASFLSSVHCSETTHSTCRRIQQSRKLNWEIKWVWFQSIMVKVSSYWKCYSICLTSQFSYKKAVGNTCGQSCYQTLLLVPQSPENCSNAPDENWTFPIIRISL